MGIFNKKNPPKLEIDKDSYTWATLVTAALAMEEILTRFDYSSKDILRAWTAFHWTSESMLENQQENGMLTNYVLAELTNEKLISAIKKYKTPNYKTKSKTYANNISFQDVLLNKVQDISRIKKNAIEKADVSREVLPLFANHLLSMVSSEAIGVELFHVTLSMGYGDVVSDSLRELELYGDEITGTRVHIANVFYVNAMSFFASLK